MGCELIEKDLVAFHYATPTSCPRCEIETHLEQCPRCLQAYFSIKRSAETPTDELPSARVQARLRRAVAIEVGASDGVGWKWWERPLAFGMAAASLAACFALWNIVSPFP